MKMKKVIAMLLTGCMAVGTLGMSTVVYAEDDAAQGAPKEISMWVYQEDMQKVVDEFEKTHPDIHVEVVIVADQDYEQKLQTSLAAGTGIPDIITMNGGVSDAVAAFDIYEDLEQEPYNFDKTLIPESYWPKMTNEEGKIIGIASEQAFAGLAYRKEPVKELLGTDDPKELEAMLPDWNSFIEVGQKVKEETDGKTFMLSSLGEAAQILSKQTQETMVTDKTVNLDGEFKTRVIDNIIAMRDTGVADGLTFGSAAWLASFTSDDYLFRAAPLWSPEWWFKANDPDGVDKWGLMNIPEGNVHFGGGIYSITQYSENKEAAWEFLQWMLLSKEGANVTRDALGWSVAYKEAYDDPDYTVMTNPNFGDVNIGEKYFNDISQNVVMHPVSVYDSDIQGAWEIALEVVNKDDSVDGDGFLSMVKDELMLKNAELTIE